MDNNTTISSFLILDIETVPFVASFEELSEDWKQLWEKKSAHMSVKDTALSSAILWKSKAGIYAEFSKIICVGLGFLQINDKKPSQLFWKMISSEVEKDSLNEFILQAKGILTKYPNTQLSGHNIQEFDLPFLCRRMLAHRISVPAFMPRAGSKPWENHIFDTMKWWRFGDMKHYTSLDLIAHVLDIPTSKDSLDGSKVSEYFYHKKDLSAIVNYCKKDVILSARVLLHFLNKPPLDDEHIHAY